MIHTYGPYQNSRGYLFVVHWDSETNKHKSQSYARYKLGLVSSIDEVHHKDGNIENNELENLELLTREEHKLIHKRPTTWVVVKCTWCKIEFSIRLKLYNSNKKRGKGNFCCSLSCAGKNAVKYRTKNL